MEHYNFGMRVLKKVLLKCGELKQQSMEDRRQENAHVFEMLQCQRAMLRMVLPGLLPEVRHSTAHPFLAPSGR